MNTQYYYDDNSVFDHWRASFFDNDEDAIEWADRLNHRFGGGLKGILYKDATHDDDNNFIVVKEYNTGSVLCDR